MSYGVGSPPGKTKNFQVGAAKPILKKIKCLLEKNKRRERREILKKIKCLLGKNMILKRLLEKYYFEKIQRFLRFTRKIYSGKNVDLKKFKCLLENSGPPRSGGAPKVMI